MISCKLSCAFPLVLFDTVAVMPPRLQVSGAKAKYGGSIAKCYRLTWAEGGMNVMFAGCVPRMLVVGPLFGITFLAFEAQKEYMLRE